MEELQSDKDLTIRANTLVLGSATVDGTLKLSNGRFLVICGGLRSTNLLTGCSSSLFLDHFQIARLLHVAQSDAVAYCFGDSEARYVLSGRSMGCLTLDNARLTAEVIDDYVRCVGAAKTECQSGDLIRAQFPDYVSEADWEGGDESFWAEQAPSLGILNADQLDPETLFELGYEAIARRAGSLTVFDAAEKIVASEPPSDANP